MARLIKCSIFIILAVFMVVGCGKQPSTEKASASKTGEVLTRVKDSDTLTVGFEGTYMPFNFQDSNKEFAGFDVDISKEIAKRMGVKVKFVATQWDGLIGGVKADKFDIIIAQMSITDERKKSVDFTEPYVKTGGVLITRKDTDNITKLEDLKGKKVGVGGGTTFETTVKQVKGADVKLYKGVNEYIQDLINGRLDVIMNDQLLMGYNIKEKKLPIKITSDVLNEDSIGMAIKKGNRDFVKEVNQALDDIKKDGTYETIFKKWFGVEPVLQ
jgi:L-cystine transport system substrate-binding protein